MLWYKDLFRKIFKRGFYKGESRIGLSNCEREKVATPVSKKSRKNKII